MKQISIRGYSLLALFLAGVGFLMQDPAFAASGRSVRAVTNPTRGSAKKARPAWKEIEKLIRDTLAQKKNYKPGDLLTQDDAKNVLKVVAKKGWTVKPSYKLPERLLPESDDMVKLLRAQQGNKFMRQIAGVPGGYDRLDKLRRQPNGSRRLRELMSQPYGYKLIEYLATTPAGKNTGKELSRGRKNFNAPTKRIYSEGELLAALKVIYAEESAEPSQTSAR